MSEYKSKRNWINNAPLTIVDLGSLHPPASGSLLVTTATASAHPAALQTVNSFCVICLKVNNTLAKLHSIIFINKATEQIAVDFTPI